MTAMLLHTRPAFMRISAATVAICLVTAGCSSSSKSTGGGGGAPSATTGASRSTTGAPTVHVKNFSFNPGTVTVKTGATVTWIFDDSAKHNVTAEDKSFKSTDQSSGGSYTFTFNTAGTYSYICSIHQYMTGKVVVQ